MNSDLIVDLDLVQQSAKALKANPPDPNTIQKIQNDPNAFLTQCGVKVSDKILQMIKSKGIVQTQQASIVHMDIG